MAAYRRKLGALGEGIACGYLEQKGYLILERNFRCREGEIDIIARKDDCIVFAEVRTRRSPGFGTPEESVTLSKRERLAALSEAYLQTCDALPPSWRIDVVAIELEKNGAVRRIEHIENAVG
ncbi:YraN family protein [Chloroflexota bacterium]